MEEQNVQNEITINIKNILLAEWSRKWLMIKVFTLVLLYFIASTYWTEKSGLLMLQYLRKIR